MTKRILVIGPTGGIGSEIARAALAEGLEVRAFHRNPKKAAARMPLLAGATWVKGDAMRARDVLKAAKGCDVIFHGANPPGYKKWRQRAIPMLTNTVKAAEAVGSRIAFPGNVYNYGDDAFPALTEQSPQNPKTTKGQIRVEMEYILQRSTAPVLVVRAGDFFGPHAPGAWLNGGIVTAGKPIAAVTYPGDPALMHAFAYLPDMAETFIRLLNKVEDVPGGYDVFHFAGHTSSADTRDNFADAIKRVAGNPDMPTKRLPWMLLRLAGHFNETFRELWKMKYLWDTPHRLDNSKLVAVLGSEPHTPLDAAMRTSLEGLGCLEPAEETAAGHAAPQKEVAA